MIGIVKVFLNMQCFCIFFFMYRRGSQFISFFTVAHKTGSQPGGQERIRAGTGTRSLRNLRCCGWGRELVSEQISVCSRSMMFRDVRVLQRKSVLLGQFAFNDDQHLDQ
jgi:hypothetical protein